LQNYKYLEVLNKFYEFLQIKILLACILLKLNEIQGIWHKRG